MSMKKNRFLLWLLPLLASLLIKIWFGSCRVQVGGAEKSIRRKGDTRAGIAVCWHYALFFMLYQMRHYPKATILVSSSNDGEYVARLVERLGYRTARGSRHRKGVQGLKQMLGVVQEGGSCALVADGSKGPPLVAQSGAVLLSSRSGLPIVPLVWSASHYITFRSWDRLALPLPFSRIEFLYGEEIYVPAGIEKEEIEQWRRKLEESLRALYKEAWGKFNKEGH